MNIDNLAFDQVSHTLAKQFDSLYYVEIETGSFIEFFHSEMLSGLNLPEQGNDFFSFLYAQKMCIFMKKTHKFYRGDIYKKITKII